MIASKQRIAEGEARKLCVRGAELCGLWAEEPEKTFLSTNYRPLIVGTDDAIWDRLRLVPFLIRIPEEERRPMDQMLAEFGSGLPLRICSTRLALCSPCLCVFNSSPPGFRTRSLPWLRR